jgi:purine-binding chemotaxis protein CheW
MAMDRTATKSEMAQTSGQFSTFFVADLFFGVDVLHVQEVLRSQQMTPVPQAPEVIEGLINLRGQIVTAIDMRRRLRMPRLAGDRPPMNIVISTPDGAVSLLVDKIGDVLDMDASNYERPPDNLDPAARELIRGVYKLKNGLLLVLNSEKAVEVGGSLASLNAKFDAASSEATATGRCSFSPVPDAFTVEQTGSAQSQHSTRKGTRRVAAKKDERHSARGGGGACVAEGPTMIEQKATIGR